MMDPHDSQDLVEQLRRAIITPFDAVLALRAPTSNDMIVIDGTNMPPQISHQKDGASKGANHADCTIHGEIDALKRIVKGERALESAYLSGHILIAGDMSVLARLDLAPEQ